MKEKYADIIVDISHEKLDRTFQYEIPEELSGQIENGMRVAIPFGRGNKVTCGYVVGLSARTTFDTAKIKKIIEISPDAVTIESKMIALAAWIKEAYGSTMIQALKTVMPVRDKVKIKEKKTISLLIDIERAEELRCEAKQRGHVAKERFLKALMLNENLPIVVAVKDLKVARTTIKAYEDAGIIKITSHEVFRNPLLAKAEGTEEIVLSKQQQEAFDGIKAEWKGSNRTCLIHGITGSGKTHIYIRLIEEVLAKGKQAIVLIPEIALTYQTVNRFYEQFGGKIAVIHSRMSQGERSDSFEQARRGDIQIMIGPRSALFAPFAKLGLIIIDEEQESAYKSEGTPRFHAREVAVARGKIENAKVILASATPSLESYYNCQIGEYALFKLTKRFGKGELPKVEVVDLRAELRTGNNSILSGRLTKAIEEALAKEQQIMLFLNRRGYAGFVSCRSCGYVAKCPHCDVSLSLHTNGKLTCHYCGYETAMVKKCPKCESPYVGGFKAGTQQIEEIINKYFPQAKVLRMDMDTTARKGGHAKILSAFENHEADILIGTQMIVKGHDFKKVTLVGILAADLSLYADDYRCAERTFQLLVQAIGRAGRADDEGVALIQTYNPEHYCIETAQSQDYGAFYEEEMSYRELLGYPPVCGMLAIMASGENEEQLILAMEYIKKYILKISKGKRVSIIGPAKDSVAKINDRHRMVMYLKSEKRDELRWIRDEVERYIEINSGFNDLYIQFD